MMIMLSSLVASYEDYIHNIMTQYTAPCFSYVHLQAPIMSRVYFDRVLDYDDTQTASEQIGDKGAHDSCLWALTFVTV